MRSDHRVSLLRRKHFSPALFSLTFHVSSLAREIAPGQFVMLDLPGRVRPYLRRAYSVADADAASGEIEFLVKTVGPGTAALADLPEGSAVSLLGPLGNEFSLEGLQPGERVAVVAGGIGAAPFPFLFKALAWAG
ncbi:MAG TPA: FAD-binding oxidoreductase, partial [Thermoanaerobaculia bacterium]|nr:FAD-binding oxidoreductase [Thermoanaerobaculia bacterium]